MEFYLIKLLLACVSVSLLVSAQNFPVSIIHLNDFHARFEEVNSNSGTCKPEDGEVCIGGYGRVVTTVKRLYEEKKDLNPIYLNAGDNFQGTLWYNIHRWNVTSYFLNLLPADVMTLGNHEFDHQVSGVVPFLDTINSPIVIANVDATEEPTFDGKFTKSYVIEKYSRKIGVIGVMLQTTPNIASTGKLKFTDEATAVREEAAKLKSEGIDIIIVLSHSGLEVDVAIAENGGPDIDVIVGGHSHTFLWTGEDSPGPDYPRGEYPTIVQQSQHGNRRVLIVQASAYTKYLGDITVYFDAAGELVSYSGAPIYLGPEIQPDPAIQEELIPWKVVVDQAGLRVIGHSKIEISKQGCSNGECNSGSLITDAYVHSYVIQDPPEKGWTRSALCVTNTGGIRSLPTTPGSLNYGDLVAIIPFENTLDLLDLRGDHVLEMLEFSASSTLTWLQVSGMRIVFNMTKPVGQRVAELSLLCNECDIPVYEPLDTEKMYKFVMPSFLAGGGDGYYMVSENKQNHVVGHIDIDAFERYVAQMSPLMNPITGRITVVT
ncbi:apyrase [Lutzomyia longipalpis]|uniref:apyrase n=1 Tax=Lutzomyia longipalpis TaxID=7200 RepID=UPI002483F0EF|nr:apyrase [Lutzomyia longipalpis]